MNRRLGAGTYLLSMSSSAIAWSLATGLVCTELAAKGRIGLGQLNFIVSALGVAMGSLFYAASARRLMDLNFPGWCVKILAFPITGVVVLPLLCFLSGQRWTNDFGPARPPSGFLKIALALVLLLVAIPVCRWALLVYLQTRVLLLNGGY
ncbi:DUF805 domain-containing protein [Paraburkholderia bannensis]|uniref:DUF805 domain-containing protein n=1 Tax=Paraburkholderia bannensis TaxID=765414 RepID=UPI002AC37213|nr:DUF805 domain-containing protein [Paraburkholderia bannensis]